MTRAIEPAISTAISARNGTPSVEAPKAWIESRMPERTRNVPSTASMPVARMSETFHTFSIPRFSCTITECRNAVPGQPGQQRGVLDRIPRPVAAPAQLGRRTSARRAGCRRRGRTRPPSAKRRVARIQSASSAPRHERADREREGDREQRVPRVQHRRVDHHARVAQQRVQPDALGGGRRHGLKRRDRKTSSGGEEGRRSRAARPSRRARRRAGAGARGRARGSTTATAATPTAAASPPARTTPRSAL